MPLKGTPGARLSRLVHGGFPFVLWNLLPSLHRREHNNRTRRPLTPCEVPPMFPRSLAAVLFLTAACGGLAVALHGARDGAEPPARAAAAPKRVLPGVQPTGEVRLPNSWSLRPAGKQVPLGDFPVNLALHPTGRWLAALHAGFGTHEVIIVDLEKGRERVACRVPLEQTWLGVCFSPDGKTLYASGAEFEVVHAFAFEDGLLGRRKTIRVAAETDKFIPGGL